DEQALSMRSLGQPYAPQHLKDMFHDPDMDYNKIRAYRRKIMEEHLEKVGIELKPGAIEILTYLKEKGIHRAISTANDIERAEKYLKKIGLYGYFDKIICAPMVEHGKPAPDVYEFACSELKLAPEECMAVEDSPNGVKSAYSAGCKVVMVPDLTQPDEELKKMLFACVDRIDEIKSIV
ncbi:MAG: HAD family hydrolase, partial [Lachnospiraceae bacterium]|nr:HAD family hydrolase [Lachnospiraceae bacterium]